MRVLASISRVLWKNRKNVFSRPPIGVRRVSRARYAVGNARAVITTTITAAVGERNPAVTTGGEVVKVFVGGARNVCARSGKTMTASVRSRGGDRKRMRFFGGVFKTLHRSTGQPRNNTVLPTTLWAARTSARVTGSPLCPLDAAAVRVHVYARNVRGASQHANERVDPTRGTAYPKIPVSRHLVFGALPLRIGYRFTERRNSAGVRSTRTPDRE